MIYHRLVVDWPFCDGNDLKHDGALRPRLLIGRKETTWINKQICMAYECNTISGLILQLVSTYHNLDNLLRFHPIHRKTIHLYDPVPCMQ